MVCGPLVVVARCEILFKTFGMVLRRDGISNGSHATMPEFMGICAASGMDGDSEKATEQ